LSALAQYLADCLREIVAERDDLADVEHRRHDKNSIVRKMALLASLQEGAAFAAR
jgi:hypothetical protein